LTITEKIRIFTNDDPTRNIEYDYPCYFINHRCLEVRKNMKKIYVIALIAGSMLTAGMLYAETLIQAYNAASAGSGYDKLILLDRNTLYTGGLELSDESVCILSAGAVIDLQGGLIYVNSSASLDICGVVLKNGSSDDAALKYNDGVKSWVDHCTFFDNYTGLRFWQNADLKITSNIFSESSHYGVYAHEYTTMWMSNNDAWQNKDGDYRMFCPT